MRVVVMTNNNNNHNLYNCNFVNEVERVEHIIIIYYYICKMLNSRYLI